MASWRIGNGVLFMCFVSVSVGDACSISSKCGMGRCRSSKLTRTSSIESRIMLANVVVVGGKEGRAKVCSPTPTYVSERDKGCK